MTTVVVSRRIQELIAKEMAAGGYKSKNALLTDALAALADRRQAIECIRRGLADAQAGRGRSRKEFQRAMLKRHPELAAS
jgi:predicted transcriptional regulator